MSDEKKTSHQIWQEGLIAMGAGIECFIPKTKKQFESEVEVAPEEEKQPSLETSEEEKQPSLEVEKT